MSQFWAPWFKKRQGQTGKSPMEGHEDAVGLGGTQELAVPIRKHCCGRMLVSVVENCGVSLKFFNNPMATILRNLLLVSLFEQRLDQRTSRGAFQSQQPLGELTFV